MDRVNLENVLRMVSDIVVAYLGQRAIEPEQVAVLVRDVRVALTAGLDLEPAAARPRDAADGGTAGTAPHPNDERIPAVPVAESITDEYLVSLEDGQRYRSLRRHLMAKYDMTPEQYRAKWGLPPDYPMVAPSYARERSDVAKRIGLGRTPAPSPENGHRRRG